jgi:transglutaminase-like putative cysteine protease
LRRTLAVSLCPAAVLAIVWLRLESPAGRPLTALGVTVLALLPALIRPVAARLAASIVALGGAVLIAFEVSPLHPENAPGSVGRAFANGFLDFYDVRTPFDSRVHTEMRGVVLVAVFGFVLAVSLAIAARRPIAAALVLLIGAGWPATLRGNGGSLLVGAAILLGTLAVLAGLTTRHVPRAVLPAALMLALAAVVASTSTAVAKSGLVSWQGWDFYTAPQAPVSVAFVWNGQYSGVHFPRKRTTVLEVKAPPRSLYWRAAVLDLFAGDRWVVTEPFRGDALLPAAAQNRAQLLRQEVRVLALSDTRLVGASVPVAFDAGDAPVVSHIAGFATLPSGLTRGFRYTAWSYAPRPTAAQLARSKPIYPIELVEEGAFLDLRSDVTMPAFRPQDHGRAVAQTLAAHHELAAYAPLAKLAVSIGGSARTPYGAAAALESWFRVRGGFVYANQPPPTSGRALVDFVTRTRAGYCQHFAGAMALMLRYLGIPARVAVGFSSGRYDAKRGVWTVTDHDAHAWVEAWFRGYGWLPFDPTPAAGRPARGQLSAPYATAARLLGVGGSERGSHELRRSGHRHREPEGTGPNAPVRGGGAGPRRKSHGGSLLLLLAIMAGAAVAALVGTKIAVRRARYVTRDPRRLAAACRQELAGFLLDQNIEAARSATLHELGALVRRELQVDPDAFVAAASAARFGPPANAAPAARDARRELRALVRRMRLRLSERDRVRGLLSLRSLGLAP